MAQTSYRVLILGGGTAGLSVASRLAKKMDPRQIAIVEPSETHYYQPYWTLAGAGVVDKKASARSQASLMPPQVTWIQEKVVEIDPDGRTVTITNHSPLQYEFLIVATGLRLAWEKIRGLPQALGQNEICSIYDYRHVDTTAQLIKNFAGGEAIFTMPPVPIKCAGAPQKIMYLADDRFRRQGVRAKSRVTFATAGKAMFGLPVFSKRLDEVVKRREITPKFSHLLVAVNAEAKQATFLVGQPDGTSVETTFPFDLLHVVPPMQAHDLISQNPRLSFTEGDQKGWLAVDKFTLQHLKYQNIYGIGDVTGIPNSKTGAAVRKQAPVVVHNLLATMKGEAPTALYDGYSSCPLVTGLGKVILAEFGYDGKLLPSFPLNPLKERRSMWHLKKDLLPTLYWQGMLKGRA